MEALSALLALCAGNSPATGKFPAQRPVTRSFHVFFDPLLSKRLSKQSWGWWFETPSWSLWRHGNAHTVFVLSISALLLLPICLIPDLWWNCCQAPRPITAANPLIEIYQWLVIAELLQQGFGSYGISWNNTPVRLFLCWHVEAWIKWHYICIVKHMEAETKWPLFSRRHFQIYFHEWKCMNFD